jgi:hypothetical protein
MIKAVMFSYLHLIAHFQYAHCIQCTQLNVNNVQYYVFVVYYCVFPIWFIFHFIFLYVMLYIYIYILFGYYPFTTGATTIGVTVVASLKLCTMQQIWKHYCFDHFETDCVLMCFWTHKLRQCRLYLHEYIHVDLNDTRCTP